MSSAKSDYFEPINRPSPQHTTTVRGDWTLDNRNDLFARVFRHHVLERPLSAQFKERDDDLTDQKISHMFHTGFYTPRLLLGYRGGAEVPLDDFFFEFSRSPITKDTEVGDRLGPNKLIALIGKVGTGKSTFISHLMVRYFSHIRRERIRAYRVDVEEFAGRDIDPGRFFKALFERLQNEVFSSNQSDRSFWIEQFSSMAPAQDAADPDRRAAQYIMALQSLFFTTRKRYGDRWLLFLDNLDRYYYLFDRACFSPEGAKLRARAISKLAAILSEFESPGGRLDGSGLCVLIALRRHTYDYLQAAGTAAPNHSVSLSEVCGASVFRIAPSTAEEVVASRLGLLAKCAELSLPLSDRKEFLAEMRKTELLWRRVLDPTAPRRSASRGMIKDLSRFMHHGHRSLLDHLSQYRWAVSDPVAFHRIFQSYAPAILLFMLRNRQRYSQVESRFPNLFLVRGEVNSDSESTVPRRLRSPHKHTYWLKYLILQYISFRSSNKLPVDAEGILDVFCRGSEAEGYYERHIVELVLGSLAQVDSSFCIEPQYGTNLEGSGIGITDINVTDRGAFLVDRFAFDLIYLQLAAEDYLLELPIAKDLLGFLADFRMDESINYNYLVEKNSDYARDASIMIRKKVDMVASFLAVLEAALIVERERRRPVFAILARRGVPLPQFKKISDAILAEVRGLGTALGDAGLFAGAEASFERASLSGERLSRFFRRAYIEVNV